MTKAEFIAHFKAMYRVGNRSDADEHEDWTDADMAGYACCRPLDEMSRGLVKAGVWTEEERQAVYDDL